MSDLVYSVYPLGYVTGKRDDYQDRTPDKRIMTLWYSYHNTESSVEEFRFTIRSILEYAYDVFESVDGVYGFFEKNLNKGISGYKLKFLADTLSFITTGKRSIGLESWEYLLEESDNEENVPDRAANRKLPLEGYEYDKNKCTIGNWISKPDGIYDLLYTLKILFGELKPAQTIIEGIG